MVFSIILAEIKNAFVDGINDPELIELLYRGVAEPLGIKLSKAQKGVASKIVNRAPQENALRIIRGHSQDLKVKTSIGDFFKKNVTRHFMPDMEEEIIFHIRSVIRDDFARVSDSKKDELLRLEKKETFNLMKYLEVSGKYKSHLLVLDLPILSHKEKKHKLITKDITTVGRREALIQYIMDNCGDNQVIIAENELPETLDYSGVHLLNFTMGDEEGERYGFLRSVRN